MVDKDRNEWPMKVPLKHPIKVTREGEEIEVSELYVSQFKAKHLKHVPTELDTAGFLVPLIAALTGIREKEAGELNIEDTMRIADKLIPFLEGLPGIGVK